jgi:hypothetical protein
MNDVAKIAQNVYSSLSIGKEQRHRLVIHLSSEEAEENLPRILVKAITKPFINSTVQSRS